MTDNDFDDLLMNNYGNDSLRYHVGQIKRMRAFLDTQTSSKETKSSSTMDRGHHWQQRGYSSRNEEYSEFHKDFDTWLYDNGEKESVESSRWPDRPSKCETTHGIPHQERQ
ncbi:uncharacterized protein L201_007654 [Kwoniella dendrophila CBS 6074]|uniref:Uncharacterized protein n=1 Tax=Kwoniella dendrophila CBS 6074 TaxID=1295534 RepID=A0AAX4K529_9TREE